MTNIELATRTQKIDSFEISGTEVTDMLMELTRHFPGREVVSWKTCNRNKYRQSPDASHVNGASIRQDFIGGDLVVECKISEPGAPSMYQVDVQVNDERRPFSEHVIRNLGFEALTRPVRTLNIMGELYLG